MKPTLDPELLMALTVPAPLPTVPKVCTEKIGPATVKDGPHRKKKDKPEKSKAWRANACESPIPYSSVTVHSSVYVNARLANRIRFWNSPGYTRTD